MGRSNLLANLATFGITGNMLARYGATGASTWVKVIGAVLRHVDQGWGRWAEGLVDEEQEDVRMVDDRSDDDEDQLPGTATLRTSVVPTTSRPRRQVRPTLPKNLGPKLLLIASPSHLATLSTFLTSPTSKAPTSLLVDFAQFALALLNAFRGSPKWEGILDGLLEGPRGRALGRRLWLEGVRGRWRNSGDKSGWDSFFNSTCRPRYFSHFSTRRVPDLTFCTDPSTPTLLFMTHLYNHYLLLTPDDEFFSASNPLSLDEVQELAGIWKDLAFWGYMNGVAPAGSSSGMGTEEERNLFTRGVTRVAERK
jgi:ubiquitin-protein ligase E3 C